MAISSELRVLVVEDHPDISTLYGRLLPGCNIDNAFNGRVACQALEKAAYDLVILDMHLGEVSGLDVLRFARSLETHRQTRILVISADDSLKHEARESGANYWLNKPLDFDRLFDYLDRELAL